MNRIVYRYFNICANERSDEYLNSSAVLRRIDAVETLKPKSPAQFEFLDGSNWFLVSPLIGNNQGNYASDGTLPEQINLIEVITSDVESDRASNFTRSVAARIGWKVIEVTPE